jgi:hypothetical protein
MTSEQSLSVGKLIIELIQVIVWPIMLLVVLLYFGKSLRKFSDSLGEFTFALSRLERAWHGITNITRTNRLPRTGSYTPMASRSTEYAAVHAATGNALEHLEKAMRIVEELGRDEKRKRTRRS